MISNGPWLALCLAAIFTLMNVAVRNGVIIFYLKYYVGDDGTPIFLIFDKTAVFMSTGLVTMLVGIACTKFLSKRFGKRRLMMTLTVLNAMSMGLFFFIPAEQFLLMVIVNCLGTILAGPMPVLVWAMYADTADYGEWKSERRTTALIFSALQSAQKLGLMVGAGLSGIILSLFGYVANEIQTETSMLGIRLMFSIFPAILALLSGVAFYFYPLTDERMVEVESELKKRHAEAEQGSA